MSSAYKQLVKESTSLGGMPGERGGNSSTRWAPGGNPVEIADHRLSGFEQIEFPVGDNPVNRLADTSLHTSPSTTSKLGNGPKRGEDGNLIEPDAFRTSSGGEQATIDMGFEPEDQNDELPDSRVFSESEIRELVREELKAS